MPCKKKVDYIDLTKDEDETCEDKKIEFKEFEWCRCMQSISISVRDVNKQPADSTNVSMNSSNAKDASSYGMASFTDNKITDNADGSPDCTESSVIDVKPK